MYHDVYNESPKESGFEDLGTNHYKLESCLFKSHIELIRMQNKDVILTFDDGGSSFYDVIAPILDNYGIKGHFFIPTNYIGKAGFLSREQIKDLYSRGHIIGSHSLSHPDNLTSLSVEERKREWQQSIGDLNQILGEPINEVSIPNGYYDKYDIKTLKELGITCIYTSSPSDNYCSEKLKIIGRFSVIHSTSAETLKKLLNNRSLQFERIIKDRLLTFVKFVLGDRYLKIKGIIRKIGNNE